MFNGKRNLINNLMGAALCAVAMGLPLSSCNGLIYDDLDPCPYGVSLRFVYDYNMEFANAFPAQVDCLTLYVYDGDGRYVTTRTVTGPELRDEAYRMTLDLTPGDYRFVAYGGMACDESSFSMVETPDFGSLTGDRRVLIDRSQVNANVARQRKLHDLFWGELSLTSAYPQPEGTVKMMKNTNNIRVVLQQEFGGTVDVDDFEFEITDNNALLNYDNTLITDNVLPLTYKPWTTGQSQTGVSITGSQVQPVPVIVAYAEMSTSRLVEKSNARLVIRRKADGEAIVDFPLVKYLELLCSDYYKEPPFSLTTQEYLDRESSYELFFFLRPDNSWLDTRIVINDWVVRINDIEV